MMMNTDIQSSVSNEFNNSKTNISINNKNLKLETNSNKSSSSCDKLNVINKMNNNNNNNKNAKTKRSESPSPSFFRRLFSCGGTSCSGKRRSSKSKPKTNQDDINTTNTNTNNYDTDDTAYSKKQDANNEKQKLLINLPAVELVKAETVDILSPSIQTQPAIPKIVLPIVKINDDDPILNMNDNNNSNNIVNNNQIDIVIKEVEVIENINHENDDIVNEEYSMYEVGEVFDEDEEEDEEEVDIEDEEVEEDEDAQEDYDSHVKLLHEMNGSRDVHHHVRTSNNADLDDMYETDHFYTYFDENEYDTYDHHGNLNTHPNNSNNQALLNQLSPSSSHRTTINSIVNRNIDSSGSSTATTATPGTGNSTLTPTINSSSYINRKIPSFTFENTSQTHLNEKQESLDREENLGSMNNSGTAKITDFYSKFLTANNLVTDRGCIVNIRTGSFNLGCQVSSPEQVSPHHTQFHFNTNKSMDSNTDDLKSSRNDLADSSDYFLNSYESSNFMKSTSNYSFNQKSTNDSNINENIDSLMENSSSSAANLLVPLLLAKNRKKSGTINSKACSNITASCTDYSLSQTSSPNKQPSLTITTSTPLSSNSNEKTSNHLMIPSPSVNNNLLVASLGPNEQDQYRRCSHDPNIEKLHKTYINNVKLSSTQVVSSVSVSTTNTDSMPNNLDSPPAPSTPPLVSTSGSNSASNTGMRSRFTKRSIKKTKLIKVLKQQL